MRKIESDSKLRQLQTIGEGFIYNDFSRRGASGKDYNVLHASACGWLSRTNVNVPKYFFDTIDEATNWLNKNRGKEGINWKRCGTCLKDKSASLITEPSSIMREKKIEDVLVNYLKKEGYTIQKQVRVSSGIIDVVATGLDGKWIIEVKGEDRGGYTSADMNFQMGIGQLISRMTNPQNNYALAFPITRDFKRVLKKFKGTIGFELLNINFFAIHRDKKVDKYGASSIRDFINSL